MGIKLLLLKKIDKHNICKLMKVVDVTHYITKNNRSFR